MIFLQAEDFILLIAFKISLKMTVEIMLTGNAQATDKINFMGVK